MKKILVTGGAGFIGSHLVDKLLELGHEVRILDNLDPQVHSGRPDYLSAEAEFIQGDVRREADLKKALKGVEVVFHEAAAVGVGQSMYQINKYIEVNTGGTALLLDLIVNSHSQVEKLVVASSMSVYGEGAYTCSKCGPVYTRLRNDAQLEAGKWDIICPRCGNLAMPVPTEEDKVMYPTSVYAISKRDQEEMCLMVGRAYKIPTVALRYFNTYGTRQSLSNPYTGVAAIFLSRLKNGKPPIIFEDGKQQRDFVSVHDIVQANILAMEKEEADYQTFNVGTGRPVNIYQIAQTLINLTGGGVAPEVVGKYRTGDIRHCYADISRIKSKLSYKPRVNLEEGMKELIAWGEKALAQDKSAEAGAELKKRKLLQ